MSDNSPSVYVRESDGAVVIRASALGRCARYLWAILDGIEPTADPEYLSRAAGEGNLHEPAIRKQMIADGHDITTPQQTFELWIIPGKLVIVGHIDGYCANHNRVAEIKTMSRKVFDDWLDGEWESKPDYAWQLSHYMLAAGWPDKIVGAHYAAKRRDDGLMWHKDYDEPPISLKAIRSKALEVYKAYKSDTMPPCEARYPCPVFFLHDEEKVDEGDVEEAPGFDELALSYVELGKVIADLTKERKDIKAQMDDFRDGRDKWSTEGFTVKISEVPKTNLDKAAIAVEHGDGFLKRYEVPAPYDRWTVKERK